MAKQTDREEKEFQEILEALQEGYEELMADSEEGGLIAFWADEKQETVKVRCSDGSSGSISYSEFMGVRNQIGKKCLVCAGLLGWIFDSESKPVLYLVCNRCEKRHRVALDELCLSDD